MSISWKSVIIKKSEKIFLKQNQLCIITNEKEALFNLKDINCIILENNYTYITTQILAKLVINNIFIIICDDKYDPLGITLSLNQHWQPLTIFEKQINMTEHFKLQLRSLIIEYKIKNTLIVMKNLKCKEKSISMVDHFSKTIILGDKTNREGLTAKVFFRELYGSNFIRFSDNGINSALNYGYKILMSAISRTISKYGLNNYLGIFHIGKTNPFNLACDFLEPLRPLVDYWVTKHIDTIQDHISYNHRLELINLLNQKTIINNKIVTITRAIDYMIRSFITCLNEQTINKLELPILDFDLLEDENNE
ncbi:type II CRISPR-associated endonuclease Cas1 [Spiroplasma endosymbiont of Tricholauxania praeusta]|uniref:type II CRISPR-associated endonuclease Cas1 n=1 Tax=Spiroplasma endosymbiont of Tricholauxania praeusta TaxID=3066296 RepID=UPI0030D5F3DC